MNSAACATSIQLTLRVPNLLLQVAITTRHLLSHLSGIRHYLKKGEKKEDEMDCKEYFLKDRFNSVNEALELFKNDELLNSPGDLLNCKFSLFQVE